MTTIQVSDLTKDRLDQLKPRGVPYDRLVAWLLDARHPAEWEAYVRERAELPVRVAEARRLRRDGARAVTRDPGEQVVLADVAAERWRAWVAMGRIEERGPRDIKLNLPREVPRARIRRV